MNARLKTHTAPICPHCKSSALFLTSSEAVYNGRDFGPVWVCWPCEAWVGCHRGTSRPLGRLANKELRLAKREAHNAFDPLWMNLREAYPDLPMPSRKHKGVARTRAYAWLAGQLGIDRRDCHIGMFDVEQCRRTIAVIQEQAPTAAFIRAWAKA